MSKKVNLWTWIQDKLLILLFTLYPLLPASPLISPYANRDSGIFLYFGWRILNGEMPYVDVFDHKPPIIFYINALGLYLTNNSRWGVWFIEFICIFIAAYTGYVLIKRIFGENPAILSTFLWLSSLVFLFKNGNFTEDYVLPLQFITLFLIFKTMENEKWTNYFVIGILGGLAFYTKQTLIGIWLSIVIYLVIYGLKKNCLRHQLKNILVMFLGGILITLIIIGYFYFNDAFFELWESAFLFNFYYSIDTVNSFLIRIIKFFVFPYISRTDILHFGVLGMGTFICVIKNIKNEVGARAYSLSIILIVDFILELLLINLPERSYDHYFISLLPTLTFFTGFLFYIVASKIEQLNQNANIQKQLFLVIALGIFVLSGLLKYEENFRHLQRNINGEQIAYVIENTTENDPVLVWGEEAMVNFHSKRVNPTKYVFVSHLYMKGYATEALIIGFLDDIIQNRPKIIMDSMREKYPFFTFPIQTDEIQRKVKEIMALYSLEENINGWEVYTLIGD